ncbi:autotransporter domain-containing protein [Bradyrhizobium amphicarpaeae]|nr:autotransporter domain-containing protein [Bradyrhizobium amphicarpaeae]
MHHRLVFRRDKRAMSGKLSFGNGSALLATFATALIAVLAGHPGSALAACAVTASPNTVTCNSTVTTNTTNTDAASASSTDRGQAFSTGAVSATINAGQTVSGFGLAVSANGAGINVVNNGAVTTTQAVHALDISTSTGNIVYSGNGSASNTANSGIGLNMNTNGPGTITVGTSATPVTPTFQGSTAMQLIAASSINMAMNGGSLTTLSSFGDGALVSGGDVKVALTGNSTIINASGAMASRGLDIFGSVAISVSSNATIGGATAATSFNIGILASAFSASGNDDVTVNQTGGTIFATNLGINASNGTGSGTVTVNTAAGSAITLTDPGGSGIEASTNSAGAAVTVNQAGAITGGAGGINAVIFSAANSRDINITSSGLIDATSTGINAFTAGSGNINVTTSGVINGPEGGGIIANSVDGHITVNVNAGTVRGSAAGFLNPGVGATASGSGGATINIAAGATVAGPQFFGVTVSGTNNVITNLGTISGANGVLATGATTIVNAGAITTSGEAVRFNSAGSTLEMRGPAATLTGQVYGSGTDTVRFSGTGANTFDVSQVDSGWGLLDKTGSSNWTLTGTSTTTAIMTVNGGTLSVNGDITSTGGVTVNSGGTLGGIGTVSSTIINAGGSLAPGNSIGTLTVSGNLTFSGASNYVVEVSPGTADRTNVTGTATLAGTLRAIGIGGTYTPGTQYTVLNAAGARSGTFSALAISGNFGITRPHIEYDANNVYLVLDQALVSPFLVNGTRNQIATAGAVDTAFLGGSGAFSALMGLTSPQLNAALDQLSGEVHASTVGTLANDSLAMRSAILGRLRQASFGGDMDAMAALSLGGPQTAFAAYAMESALAYDKSPVMTKAPPRPVSDTVFWAQGLGAWGTFNGDGNAASVRRDLAGFITGVDTRVGGAGRLGFAAGYTGTRNTLDGRGSSNVDTAHIAGYGGWRFGSINLRAGGAYAFHTIGTDRLANFVGFADRLTSRTDGSTGQVFGEVGYGVAFGKLALEPFAGAAWVRVHADASAELGGAAALNVAAQTFETGYATLGARAATFVPLAHDMMLIPRATFAWQHAFNDVTPNAVMAFQVAPASFTISGVPVARDSLLAEAGVDFAIGRHMTIGLSYVGQLGNVVTDHAAKGKFSWAF